MNPLKESLRIIGKRKKAYYAMLSIILLILFINSFFAGQHLYKTDKDKAGEIIEKVRNIEKLKFLNNLMQEGRFALVSLLIFINNFLIDAFSVYLGVIFIFTIFMPVSNVMLLGIIIGIESMASDFAPLRTSILIIVGGLELFCMILSTYEGLRIGVSWINPKIFGKKKRKEALKQAFIEGSKILILVAVILVAAAIIETVGIAYLESLF